MVLRFAVEMEMRLRENDWNGGWDDCNTDWLYAQLLKECTELHDAVSKTIYQPNRITQIGIEAADVANFAMMIADNCCAILVHRGELE